MNNLQKRLAETERALFFALRELHDGATVQCEYDDQPSDQAMRTFAASDDAPTTRQQKARQEMRWHHMPLGNRVQAKAWLESMRAQPHAVGGDGGQAHAEAPPAAEGLLDKDPVEGLVLATQQESDVGVRRTSMVTHGDPVQQSSINGSRRKSKRAHDDVDVSRPSGAFPGPQTSATERPMVDPPERSKASTFAHANKNIYF